jgi:ferrous iron transport protein A
MKEKTVLDLKIGEWAYVKSLHEIDLTCRLMTLGILPKSRVAFIRQAPFGGAYYLKINTHIVAVRPLEAAQIIIE